MILYSENSYLKRTFCTMDDTTVLGKQTRHGCFSSILKKSHCAVNMLTALRFFYSLAPKVNLRLLLVWRELYKATELLANPGFRTVTSSDS